MRKLKSGFTLAEVLITIAVIGIVAAMTLPNMITGYQYKSIGVKLSKFAANTESSARAFVAANGALNTSANRTAFGADSFLRVNTSKAFKTITTMGDTNKKNVALQGKSGEQDTGIYTLKDGTVVAMVASAADGTATGTLQSTVDTGMYGQPAAQLVFDPHINGLPTSAQKQYTFVLTELGYVFPDSTDGCLVEIVGTDNNYSSKSAYYTDATNGKCYVKSGS